MEQFFAYGFFFTLGIITGFLVTVLIEYRTGRFVFYKDYDEPEEETVKQQLPPETMKMVYQVKDPKDIEKIIKDVFSKVNSKANFDVEKFEKLVDKEFFKGELEKNMNDHNEKQEYEFSAYYRDKIEDMDNWFDERKKFFIDNIGKRVIPDRSNCNCEHCRLALKEGLLIEDKDHALQLFSNELNGILIRSIVIYSLM